MEQVSAVGVQGQMASALRTCIAELANHCGGRSAMCFRDPERGVCPACDARYEARGALAAYEALDPCDAGTCDCEGDDDV